MSCPSTGEAIDVWPAVFPRNPVFTFKPFSFSINSYLSSYYNKREPVNHFPDNFELSELVLETKDQQNGKEMSMEDCWLNGRFVPWQSMVSNL